MTLRAAFAGRSLGVASRTGLLLERLEVRQVMRSVPVVIHRFGDLVAMDARS